MGAFLQGLQQLGWINGSSVRIALKRWLGRRGVALDVRRFAKHDFDGSGGHVDQHVVVERPGLQKQHRRPMVFDQAAGRGQGQASTMRFSP